MVAVDLNQTNAGITARLGAWRAESGLERLGPMTGVATLLSDLAPFPARLCAVTMPRSYARGEAMRRREFITFVVGGTAVAWPFSGRAQRSALPVIGLIHSGSASQNTHTIAGFHD